jgi:hypothetical protein
MTIFEYLKDSNPHPWIDSTKYTTLEVILFLVGSLSWFICYADTILSARKKQIVKIPVVAVLLNFGWEISTSFFFVPDMGKLLVISYWAWMIFDSYIFYSTFKYGYKQMQVPFFSKNARFFVIIGIVFSIVIQSLYITTYDLPLAALSAYIINLPMSIAFLYFAFLPGNEYNSKLTAWTKFIGTGLISVMFFLKYPENNFLTSMYIAVAFFDVLYIYLLYNKDKVIA